MIFKKLFGRNPYRAVARDIYEKIVQQARQPVFYLEADVPDTVDGRYEMVSLHAFLVLRRIKQEGERGQKLSQAVFDRMFADMDHSIRELGVGDLSVGKRIKAMAQVFYGRIVAYEAAIDGTSDETLEDALARNHYGTLETSPEMVVLKRLAHYIVENDEFLKTQTSANLFKGEIEFLNLEKIEQQV
jgi:cytochrome b pre-mRNA-processing protein 3